MDSPSNVKWAKGADGLSRARANSCERRAHAAKVPQTILPKLSLLLACATAASVAWAGFGFAADHTNCIAYGEAAAAAAKEVRQLACGFDLSDPRWTSTDPKPHWDWCDTASDDDVAQEWAARNNQLSACQAASNICRALEAQWYDTVSANAKYHCRIDALNGQWQYYSGNGGYYQACMQAEQGSPDDTRDFVFQDQSRWAEENNLVGQCERDKEGQIAFCESYVAQTRQAAQYIYGHCDFYYNDGRFVPEDDVRFDWCMGLRGVLDASNADYQTDGQDPVKYLETQAQACRARRIYSATRGGMRRPDLGGGAKPYGISRKQLSKSDAATLDRCRKMNPALARLSKDCAPLLGTARRTVVRGEGGGNASVDRAKNSDSGNQSVSRAAGDGSSKLLGPGLLDGDGGLGRNAPGGTGTPLGTGTSNTGRTGGSLNVR